MKATKYIAKKPDADGYIAYKDEEHAVWQHLYDRQIKLVEGRACDEFISGLKLLGLSSKHIPQCNDVNERLQALTGWSVVPVDALISFADFFQLLSNKQFPAASFIRVQAEIDYLQEPDIFHEIFGHCPMLTHQVFADFTKAVGKLGMKLSQKERVKLARLYWFTVEFGLLQTPNGLRIYGGGILSSKGETLYALDSDVPKRRPLDVVTALRMPYRYDEMQLNYFVLQDLADLYPLVEEASLRTAFAKADELGMLPNPHDRDVDEPRSC